MEITISSFGRSPLVLNVAPSGHHSGRSFASRCGSIGGLVNGRPLTEGRCMCCEDAQGPGKSHDYLVVSDGFTYFRREVAPSNMPMRRIAQHEHFRGCATVIHARRRPYSLVWHDSRGGLNADMADATPGRTSTYLSEMLLKRGHQLQDFPARPCAKISPDPSLRSIRCG